MWKGASIAVTDTIYGAGDNVEIAGLRIKNQHRSAMKQWGRCYIHI